MLSILSFASSLWLLIVESDITNTFSASKAVEEDLSLMIRINVFYFFLFLTLLQMRFQRGPKRYYHYIIHILPIQIQEYVMHLQI